jgi:hypothetical protein
MPALFRQRSKTYFHLYENSYPKSKKNMPKDQSTSYLLHCFIAGLQYYDVLEVWKSLKISDHLDLIPEPNNRFDHNAVMVVCKGKQLGLHPPIRKPPYRQDP